MLTATCTVEKTFILVYIGDKLPIHHPDIDSKHTIVHVRALTSRSKAHAHVNAPSPFQPVSSQPRAD